ncbi:MAG: Efflux ABC transporter, permease protein, partial [uncultured Blastococcus sp.]
DRAAPRGGRGADRATALGAEGRRHGGRPGHRALAPAARSGPGRRALPGTAPADVRLSPGRRDGRARRGRLPRLPGSRDARPRHGVRSRGHHDGGRHRHRAGHHRPLPFPADGAVRCGRRTLPGRHGVVRRGARRPRHGGAGDRLAAGGPGPGPRRGRAAPAPPAGVPLARDLPGPAHPGPRDGHRRADPGVAVRLPVQRLRRGVGDARLAGDRRGVEPRGGHGDGGARAAGRPGRLRRWVGDRARDAARRPVASAAHRRLRGARRPPVPGAVPV